MTVPLSPSFELALRAAQLERSGDKSASGRTGRVADILIACDNSLLARDRHS
jgi:hypothetical protein